MQDNYFSIDENARIVYLYTQTQKLQAQQIQQLTEQIINHKKSLTQYVNLVSNFLQQLENLIPAKEEKLKKISAKHQWIKLYYDQSIMQCWIHEDYRTYLTYHKISISNRQNDQKQLNNIISDFEADVSNFIWQINAKFGEKMLVNNQNVQQQIQIPINELGLLQIIDILKNQDDDILSEEEILQIQQNMNENREKQKKKLHQFTVSVIEQKYKPFIQKSLIESLKYQPQSFCYDNFADGLNVIKYIKNSIRQIDISQLNNLQSGLSHIRIKKKTIIILEVTKNKQKNAYLINYFEHYKSQTDIFNQLQKNFTCYYLRTINLTIEEAYLLIKYLKKKKVFQKKQNQTLEFYQKETFKAMDSELENKIKYYLEAKEKIQTLTSKIIPESSNLFDIYSQLFVQRLKKEKQFKFNLIGRIYSPQKIESLEYQQTMLGAVLENQNNCTQGVALYFNIRTIFVFINESQDKDKTDLNKQSNNKVKIINTKIKDIPVEVVQFYVSLLLYYQKNNVSRQIKDFLELKKKVWVNILQFLD